MSTFLALLRGINVGGHKTIKMADLKACFANDLGFADARTHLNSGNVLFSAPASATSAGLEKQISAQLEKTYGFTVEVIVRAGAELGQIAEKGPFAETEDDKEITRYVTFFKTALTGEQLAKIKAIDNPGETHVVKGTELYSELDRSKSQNLVFTGNFIDNKLKSVATTRNWLVVRMLAELAGNA